MYDAAQRLSVVIEQQDDEVVAVLIDERGGRQRSTMGRFSDRAEAAKYLVTVYGTLTRKHKTAV
jgi:hypothetical protein